MAGIDRKKVIIFHHETDKKYLERLRIHLKPLEKKDLIEVWDTTGILPGAVRYEETRQALFTAKVAILLINADFLASDFVENELPILLDINKAGGAVILSIITNYCTFQSTKLSDFQAVNNPSTPISSLNKPKQEKLWNEISGYIKHATFSLDVYEDIAQSIRNVVEDLQNGQYKPEQNALAVKGITNQRLQEQRRETCLRLLMSIRELVPIVVEYRQAHDDLRMRHKMFSKSRQHTKRIKAQFQSIQNELILAGSELSIDPNGKGVIDAFVAYMQAQARYIQEITKPMKSPLTFIFGKTDIAVLDALAEQANEQLSVFETVVQGFVQSS